jgi:hypothetical protein
MNPEQVKEKLLDLKEKTKRSRIIAFAAFCFILLVLHGCGDSSAIKLVKSGNFNGCHKTVEQAVNDFFGSPKWDSGTGSDGPTKGLTLVDLQGRVELYGKEVTAVLQFIVDEKNGTFEAHALEVNGVPQPPIMILGLVSKMCE